MVTFNLCQTRLNHLLGSYNSVLYQNTQVNQGINVVLVWSKKIKIYSKELNKIEIKFAEGRRK